jgi:hypothetical protein
MESFSGSDLVVYPDRSNLDSLGASSAVNSARRPSPLYGLYVIIR